MNKKTICGRAKNLAFLIFVFSFVSLQAEELVKVSKETAYSNLVNYKHRPSLLDVAHEFGGQIPPPAVTQIRVTAEWGKPVLASFPAAIAKLELIYPGAIWASLGRDAVPVADVLEAFYMGIGQPGRVSRVNASGSSFGRSDPKMFVQMLKDIGMDIDNSEKMRPFVMFDNTGYGSHSQSTQLITMVYNYFTQQTKQPIYRLFEKVAVASVSSGEHPKDRESFFKALILSSIGQQYPAKILNIPNISSFMYKAEWHPSFGDLTRYPNGQIGGAIHGQSDVSVKRGILDVMLEGYYAVQTFEFLQAVRHEAKKLGYDFDEHIKTYSKDWVPPKFVPREPYMEELVEQEAKKFLGGLEEKSPTLQNLTQYLINSYVAEVTNEMHKSAEALNQLKADKNLSDKQFAEHKKELIAKGFEKLDQSIRQNAEQLKLPLSDYEYLLIAFWKTFGKYESYEKTYYSTNSKQIRDMFISTVNTEKSMVRKYTLSYLRLLEVALNEGLISSKDYRRLILHALSFVVKDKKFYAALPQLFSESPKLQSYLIKHAKVYLTSKKNHGAGQKAYLEMINQNLLPKPSECDVWLSVKDEDAGDEKDLDKSLGVTEKRAG